MFGNWAKGFAAVLALVVGTTAVVTTTGIEGVRKPRGYFVLQQGKTTGSLTAATISSSKIIGGTIRFRPNWVYTAKGKAPDWSYVDKCVAEYTKAKKPFKLLPMSGDSTPSWVGGQWVNGAPLPWAPDNVKFYSDFYRELGARYGKNPLLVGVHIVGGTRGGTSEEMHPDASWKNDAGMLSAYKTWIDAANKAFPDVSLWLAISVQGRTANYVPQIVDYGLKVAPGRFGVKHNALKCVEIGAKHNVFVVNCAKRGALMGFEMVGGTAENIDGKPRTGSRNIMDSIKQGWALARQAGYPEKELYIDVYPPDLKALDMKAWEAK